MKILLKAVMNCARWHRLQGMVAWQVLQLIPERLVFCNHTRFALDKLNDHCFFFSHFGLFRGFVWTTSLVAHFWTFFKFDAIVGCKWEGGGTV